MSHWYLQPIWNSYALVVAVATVLVLLLLVRPGFRSLTGARRGTLLLLRLLVILLVALALLRPTHISTTTKPQTAVLLLLFDQSRSMQLPHATGTATRWAAQQAALEQAAPLLAELAQKLEVKVYGYDRQLQPAAVQNGAVTLPAAPTGDQTDIGSRLYDAVQRELGKRLAGVVLLGDGAQTAFRPQVEVQEAGRELARLGCPLYAVPFGPPGSAVQARDVAVENLQDQYTVFVKNELAVQATLRVRGYVNQSIPVEVTVDTPDGRHETVRSLQLTARRTTSSCRWSSCTCRRSREPTS